MKQYIVDAFANKVFEGNPAAISVLDEWLAEDLMMRIARENNLSETAFMVKESDGYRLRWFTPVSELDLVGHATLAAAFVITHFIEPGADAVRFHTLSGLLTVVKKGDLFEMDFPAYKLSRVPVTRQMTDAIGVQPVEAYMARDLLCILDSEEAVRGARPDQAKVKELDGLLLHLSAKGKEFDCVSRTFAPKCNVPEDPVCGSGHCHIIPYWAIKLGIKSLTAYQASERGGTLFCRYNGERVILGGKAALFAVADIRF